MNKPTGYSLTGYGDMINDQARMAPYVQALGRAGELAEKYRR
ncbi:hypothetical protein [Desulfonatronospira sp.]|nr:hypothetical protein [Desulfonatronospira sp.]